MSTAGFVLYFAGAPLIWAAKLQTVAAISTTESEYVALSEACLAIIHVRDSEAEASSGNIVCEDNFGAVATSRSDQAISSSTMADAYKPKRW